MGFLAPAIPLITMAATVIGGAASAVGSIQQSRAQASQAKYHAAVARNNATLAKRAADDARERGRVEELNQRIRTNQLVGRQRASLAANGVEVGTGSAIDLIEDTFKIGETDALTIRANAERDAMGYLAQAGNFQGEASLYDSSARNIRSALPFELAGTALATAGSVAGQWYQFQPRKPEVAKAVKYPQRNYEGRY